MSLWLVPAGEVCRAQQQFDGHKQLPAALVASLANLAARAIDERDRRTTNHARDQRFGW